MIEKKNDIIEALIDYLKEELEKLEKHIQELKISRDTESKSSMGDKYETGREMINKELENYQIQFDQLRNKVISCELVLKQKPNSTVEFGSLVETQKGSYLIAIAHGLFEFKNEKIFIISANSPIAQKMLGLGEGDNFEFRGNQFQIKNLA